MSVRAAAAVSAFVAALSLAAPAGAAPITWTFTGVVRVIQLVGVDAPPPDVLAALGVELGAEIHGSLTWESTTPDLDPSPAYGRYDFAVTDADFTIADWAVTQLTNENSSWRVTDLPALIGQAVTASAVLSDSSGYSRFQILNLELSRQGITSGDSLPVHPPALDALDPFGRDPNTPYGYGTDLLIIGNRCTPRCYVLRAEITSLVPETRALALCALAALALGLRRLA